MRLAMDTATDWKPVPGQAGDGSSTVVARTSPMSGAIELVVSDARSAAAVKPGQFFQIAVDAPMTLLRRPYSAAWVDHANGRLGFIFNVVGRGSAWLAAREPGDVLDLMGPLGRGFDLDGEHRVVCIAGGLGVAVFPGVVAALAARGRPVTVLVGARTAAQLIPAQRFAGAQIRMATDDGSAGHRGSVVELLPEVSGTEIFACGPTPMLQALIASADRLDIPRSSIQIALETPMGCGLGTCLGCPTPRQGGGYLLACQDGPCVRADLLDWDRIKDAFHG
jgi:dihydroorotate dehydrogenase electron transfer subunit